MARRPNPHGQDESTESAPSATQAQLFVGNVTPEADERYLERLFNVYGPVERVDMGPPGPQRSQNVVAASYAIVHMKYADDADCAIAALHLRYCMYFNLPVIVLYAKSSPTITEYGRAVSAHYAETVENGTTAKAIPLEQFDPTIQRSPIPTPPTDFTLPPMAPGMPPHGGGGGNNGPIGGGPGAGGGGNGPFFGGPAWGQIPGGLAGAAPRGSTFR